MQPPEPGDEDRVVLLDSLVATEVAEVADRAVVDGPRPGLGRGLGGDRRQQPLARAAEERDEVGRPQRLPLAGAELDVDVLGQPPLDPLELLGVEAELDDVERLRGAGELRVDGLVRAVGQALEEVGEPAPRAVREVGLVDDVRLAARGSRPRCRGEPAPRRSPRRRR